jgi:RNA polymerase sigma-70 factor (ECF subfamily)
MIRGLPSPEPELQSLMVAYQAGRVEAFDALYAALAPDVRAYLLSACRDAARADDLTQDTFLRLHRARATYQPGLPVRPWVRGIAKRVFLMDRRSSVRRERREAAVEPDQPVTPRAGRGEAPADRRWLQRGLASVPADVREPFEPGPAAAARDPDGRRRWRLAARPPLRNASARRSSPTGRR